MYVTNILLHLPALEPLECISDHSAEVVGSEIAGLGFNVTPSTELDTARFAFDDGLIGWVVGEFEDRSPALLALECDVEVVGVHVCGPTA